MNRNNDMSSQGSNMPIYDDQGNLTNRDDLSPELRDTLGLDQLEDDEAM
jgi:uncharacterized membrane protein affecting hemolysin expression